MIDARAQFVNPEGRLVGGIPQRIPHAGLQGIAIHHTVTPTPSPAATVAEEMDRLKAIENYHIGQGFGLFGYHYAAFPSGRCYQIGDTLGQRAHVAQRNHQLVGIALMGTFTEHYPGDDHMRAATEAIKQIEAETGLSLAIAGHNSWATPGNGTGCAGRLNALTTTDWHMIAAGFHPGVEPDPAPEESSMLNRYVAEANPEYFAGLSLTQQSIEVWTDSPLPRDLHVPSSAKSIIVTVYLRGGELDLLDGDGQKAGFCSGRHTTLEVRPGDGMTRPFILAVPGAAIIDRIEVLGWR